VFVKYSDELAPETLKSEVAKADTYAVNYVGIALTLDGFALECRTGDADKFAAAVKATREASKRPLILAGNDPAVLAAGLKALPGEKPMLYAANADNWEAMADLAMGAGATLAVVAPTLEALADLTEKIKAKGLEDMALGLKDQNLSADLAMSTQVRRLALKKNFRALGYPLVAFPPTPEAAVQAIAKYAGFIVLDSFAPEVIYPLLVLRQNIYTDPQKPIQVQPGVYEINGPKPESPVLITTNFSITYFSVANEVEGSGMPAWLLVTDAEGMSVLTAWAAGKFDAERIAKAVKGFSIADKVSRKRVVLPGHVAVLSGELEEELPGWEIRVGPREAVDIPKFMKEAL
jgi:acetyl-CoA decarbonylase/synthase complex subunit gamma